MALVPRGNKLARIFHYCLCVIEFAGCVTQDEQMLMQMLVKWINRRS